MNETRLTKKQEQVLTTVGEAKPRKVACADLGMSAKAFDWHWKQVCARLNFDMQKNLRVQGTHAALARKLVAPLFVLLLFAGCSITETQEPKTIRSDAVVMPPPTVSSISARSTLAARTSMTMPPPPISASTGATLVAPTQVTIPITLAWDASDWPDVAGYRIYRGGESQKYTNSVVVGSNLIVTLNLPIQKHHIAVTAFDSNGAESVATAEIIETSEYQNAVKITSRHAPTPDGSWTNGVVVWDKTNAPVPQLYLGYLIEATNRAVWK